MKLTHKDRWEQGFAALCKFRRRKGHCCPPQRHVEGKYNLGPWVITQRYRKHDLSVERKKRLDRIGFVWNWRDFAWEQGFAALVKFRRREGHCRVHHLHHEGKYNLGSWVVVQRRRARLNEIGFVACLSAKINRMSARRAYRGGGLRHRRMKEAVAP
jgi:hypothetical protein